MKKQYWTLTKAIDKAAALGIEVSNPTLIKWCKMFDLGFQLGGSGGKWYVYPDKYLRYINGKNQNQNSKPSQETEPVRSDEGQSGNKE